MNTQLEQLVMNVLTDKLGVDPAAVGPDANLEHDLGLDSLDRLELVTAVEEQIGATVPDGELRSIQTVRDALALLARHTPVPGGV